MLALGEFDIIAGRFEYPRRRKTGLGEKVMSNLIVPDDSKKSMARVIIQAKQITYINLFKNDVTPGHATVLADLTLADFGGYAQKNMTTPVVGAALDANGRAVITWDEVTFTRTGGPDNTIYGYYVANNDGALLWCERFDNPVPVTADGIFIKLTPKLTDRSEFLNT